MARLQCDTPLVNIMVRWPLWHKIILFLEMLKFSEILFLSKIFFLVKENEESFEIFEECFIFQMESSKLIIYLFGRHVLKPPLYLR
jgi:hypothetical protein